MISCGTRGPIHHRVFRATTIPLYFLQNILQCDKSNFPTRYQTRLGILLINYWFFSNCVYTDERSLFCFHPTIQFSWRNARNIVATHVRVRGPGVPPFTKLWVVFWLYANAIQLHHLLVHSEYGKEIYDPWYNRMVFLFLVVQSSLTSTDWCFYFPIPRLESC